jgi:hypothetical protein
MNKYYTDVAARYVIAQAVSLGFDTQKIAGAITRVVTPTLGKASTYERWIEYANRCRAAVSRGETVNVQWSQVDRSLVAKISELCGVTVPEVEQLDGSSMLSGMVLPGARLAELDAAYLDGMWRIANEQ